VLTVMNRTGSQNDEVTLNGGDEAPIGTTAHCQQQAMGARVGTLGCTSARYDGADPINYAMK